MGLKMEGFLALAKENAPSDLPESAIETALRLLSAGRTGTPTFYQKDLPDLYAEARRIAGRFDAPVTRRAVDSERIEIPAVSVERDQILARIDEDVARLRRVLFKNESVPFTSYEEGLEWIRTTWNAQDEPSAKELAAFKQLVADIDAKIAQINRLNTYNVFEVFTGQVAIRDPVSGDRMPVTSRSPLSHFASEVRRLSRLTGLEEPDLFAYVLAGVKPKLSPAVVEILEYGHPRTYRAAVQLTINSPAVTFEDLRSLHQIIQRSWPPAQKPAGRITRKDEILRAVVDELGGPPNPLHSREYWKRARERCEQEGLVYKNHRGPMMRWKRLEAKLSRAER